jgi:hypothetical protein
MDVMDVSALKKGSESLGTGTMQFFALFHLNLAFSSIEEEDRFAVIERCYWPLLGLAERFGPIGIEVTGFTLDEIAKRDSTWIAALRGLIAAGKVELIGSGYAQLIGPLVPARVVAANLALGHETYEHLLSIRPLTALVNEQAYSGGLVGHYLDARYTAILMDWDNTAPQHPEWNPEWRYAPQRALGTDGRSIGLLWTSTVAFQKLQRFAQDDITLNEYLGFLEGLRGQADRIVCIYASDAEIFDFRPGRYRTEQLLGTTSEWERLSRAFEAIRTLEHAELVLPTDAITRSHRLRAGNVLKLESAASPVPVKKQRKYNISRWAVTGRDNLAINAACERIYAAIAPRDAQHADWKALCKLWASDFRTHITDSRWKSYCGDLARKEADIGTAPPRGPKILPGKPVPGRFIAVETPALQARLDRRRGLAIQSLAFGKDMPCIGGLSHGHFDDISLQADWYTGNCVMEAPGEPKLTDLEWADTQVARDPDSGDIQVTGTISTPLGWIDKTLRFHTSSPRVDFDLAFHWPSWGKGSLRLGHVTLLPAAFDWHTLKLVTHNGGFLPEEFSIADQTVEHGASVSLFVSASGGLGMTEGWVELGDDRHGIRVEIDRCTAPLLCMLTHKPIAGSTFCQLVLSALELDDTRRPDVYRPNGEPTVPRRFRFSLIGFRKPRPLTNVIKDSSCHIR